jgi:3-oxoacyl-[acyl-carrier-protein] synthase-3
MTFAKIIATGAYVPRQIITNDDLAKKIDTSDEWIVKRTGIKSRHIVTAEENTVTMGVAAANIALDKAGISPRDIDLIIVATTSSENVFPSTACLIQQALKIPPCMAFDVQAVCCGFLYALSVATQYIENNQAKRALLIGTEAMSTVLDWEDRATCVLFGDGAGAAILEAADVAGVLAVKMMADGSHKDLLYLNSGRSTQDKYLRMQGNALFKAAVNYLEEISLDVMNKANFSSSQIDWFIPHQANIRILQATAKKLGISMDKVIVTIDKHANTSAASIPMALDHGLVSGKIKRGDHLLFEAIGGGLTWGAALVRY